MRPSTGLLFTVALTALLAARDESDPSKAGEPKRVPWTTSRIIGSPEAPPPYRTERAFPKLKFHRPVTITRAPGSERLFVEELGGKIVSFPDDDDCESTNLFLDLGNIPGHWRTYGLAFHPDFPKNRHVYVCYVLKAGDPKGSRVSRFTVTETDPPRADIKSEKIILEWLSGGHNGGCLQFGPDGFLYISTGDGSNPHPADIHNTGQDIGDLLASILRIDVNGTDPGKAYRVPPDNPFVKTPGAAPEVWAYGLRNPWKMAFDPKTGALWTGDVGWEMWEMIYRVEKGGNYGWSVQEGSQTVRPETQRGPTPILPPTVEHDHTEARSITGGRVYHGKRFPDLAGAYIYGDYVTGKIWALQHDGKRTTSLRELANSPLEIIDFGESKDGELYILDHAGTLGRLVPDPSAKANTNFPRKLSETGLFSSVKGQVPAAGVLPYAINAEPWADHTVAERFFAAPGLGTLGLHEKSNLQVGIVKGEWIFPNDTAIAKTLSLEMERGNPASRRRLETQVLHQDRGTWRAYTYVWNDEQTDAVLAPADGFDQTFAVRDATAPGGRVQQTWHFAARTECLICHTTRAGSILGFNVAQLNREFAGENQLQRLDRLGLFEKPLPDPLPKIPSPFNPDENLGTRARAYLHANCAHCHRRGGGGTAAFELLYHFDLPRTGLVGSRPSQGTFEIHAAENVAAGDPFKSVLYLRMAKLGPGRMPYAGSNVIDGRGLELIHDWICSLRAKPGHLPSVGEAQRAALERLQAASTTAARLGEIEALLSTTSSALYLLRAIDRGRVGREVRDEIVAAARKHSSSTVRDLFERFVPESERVKRLGTVVKPAAILALPGNAARGRELFLKSTGAQCRSCHRVGTEGTEVGPDLTGIGKKLDRAQILESILEPSKRIDPAYVTYTLETAGGIVHSGLMVKKTESEVVLRDAQAKLITVAAADVDRLVPGPKSLMPDLLLRDMTKEQVADLIAFLASLK